MSESSYSSCNDVNQTNKLTNKNGSSKFIEWIIYKQSLTSMSLSMPPVQMSVWIDKRYLGIDSWQFSQVVLFESSEALLVTGETSNSPCDGTIYNMILPPCDSLFSCEVVYPSSKGFTIVSLLLPLPPETHWSQSTPKSVWWWWHD